MSDTNDTRLALTAWLWGRQVNPVGVLADAILALPILERAALMGIRIETTEMYKDGSPGDFTIHYLADLEP